MSMTGRNFTRNTMTPEHKKLNLGCGFAKINDHWNVDVSPKCNPDEVVDLEETPYPWEDNFFTKITANNILEHLGETPRKFTAIMKELYQAAFPYSKHSHGYLPIFPVAN